MFNRLLAWLLSAAFVVLTVGLAVFFHPKEQSLDVSPTVMAQLRSLRSEPKLTDLPGDPAASERQVMEPIINETLDRLINGLPQHPSKLWVLAQLEPFVAQYHLTDTELRERCSVYVERILSVVGITSTDGAFYKYLIFI
jgi:hypothetical protein